MWDAKYDKQVKRTTSRPLASGELSYSQAWMFLGGQLLAGLGVLLSLPVQSDYLQDVFVWGVASLPLVGLYPLMKRYTNYPQLVLGLTFNWGALMGWVAVHGGSNVDWSVVGPLYGGGVCWTLIYDTLYAHQDKVDDAKLGLKSTALTFGEQGTKPILTALTAVTWGCWMLAGYNVGFGNAFDAPWYYGGVSAAAAHLLWQVHTADLNNVENLAYRFRSNNTVGWIVFASCVGGDLMMVYRINDGVGVV
jgi:4-hydroxybenzoate polyprenyltransferase